MTTTVLPRGSRERLTNRMLRQVLSDVVLLHLVASGRVDAAPQDVGDAFSRLLLWRARVVGGVTSALLSVTPEEEDPNAP